MGHLIGWSVVVAVAALFWSSGLSACMAQPEPSRFRLQSAAGTVVAAPGDEAKASAVQIRVRPTGSQVAFSIVNTGGAPVRVREVVVFDIEHGFPPDTLLYGEGFQMLSQTGGTVGHPADIGQFTDRAHYKLPEPEGFRSVYNLVAFMPRASDAQVIAFTSCRRFAGRFDVSATRLRGVIDTEGIVAESGKEIELESIGVFSGATRAEALSKLVGPLTFNSIDAHQMKPIPAGWCSWYCFGPGVTAKNITDNLDVIAKQIPRLRYIQIDDGYQPWMGDWLDTGPAFGGNVQEVLHAIKERGFEPAIWVAPFIASPESRLFKEHPEWFVKGDDDKPLRSDTVTFGGWRLGPWYCLDGTHPEARAHLTRVFKVMREQWGCTYFKLDGTFWGAIHRGKFHDPKATRIEAYKRGMEAIRAGAGADAFILGCNHPLWPSIGLVDGSRSSLDIDRSWQSFTSIGRENLLRNWQNGELWWNDPDCVVLTGNPPDNEFTFHATVIAATGGMVLSGDDLTKIATERMEMLRKLLPPTGVPAVFEDDTLAVGVSKLAGSVRISVLNWTDGPQRHTVKLPGRWRVREMWTGADLGMRMDEVEVGEIPARSGRVFECVPVGREQK